MNPFIKELIEKAQANGAKVEVIHVNSDEPKDDTCEEEMKSVFAEFAKTNKMIFDAHIEAGFNKVEALKLTLAVINSNK